MKAATTDIFYSEYKKLNTAQKEAVDSLDGPVMVVAGPGTGKTQILALRIGNILLKTDIKADGILCLTFTNSAVESMLGRLRKLIGMEAEKVNVFTFHSFGMKVIEEYYEILGISAQPKLLDDIEALVLFDEILEKNSWQYLRPRGDASRYMKDLRSLISLLKRERITVADFRSQIEEDLKRIHDDPESISTRGESKGELKKEIVSKIESLERSREVARFFELYEETKKFKNIFDYDDVLENLVRIVESSKDALADIRERYLYLLIDEHQDSSRVQNEFLKKVWGKVESPNIFVVGDDRQLIYGFSGASIEHFQGFKKIWKNAKLVTLIDNYRSTQVILDASHALLESVMTPEKLRSQSQENHPLRLYEAASKEDEIVACAMDIKEKIKNGVRVNDCAVLVPKNRDVREALRILHRESLPVSTFEAVDLFDQDKALQFIRVLKIVSGDDHVSFARSFLDSISGIPTLEAHAYLASQKMRDFSLETALATPSLFEGSEINAWIKKLKELREKARTEDMMRFIEFAGSLLEEDNTQLVSSKDILQTIITLAVAEKEKNPALTLASFVSFLERLESYGEYVPVLVEKKDGVQVLTLHSSKGLEFDYVWIAHMDEKGLNGGKRLAFTLPEAIEAKVVEKDIDQIKRKLYVAITRAKRFCSVSYARGEDGEDELAKVIQDLPAEIWEKHTFTSEKKSKKESEQSLIPGIVKLVRNKYTEKTVSASSLNNFFECSWKWYFRNFLGLPEAPSENLEFGNNVHKAIDQVLKSNKEFVPEDAEVAALLDAWVKKRLAEISPERENEQPVSFKNPKFPHLNTFGRIDLIERLPDGSLRVTDFKTGSVKRKSEVIKKDEEGRLSNLARQLAMYSYLLEGSPKWKGIKVSISRLEFLESKNPKNAIYEHVVTEADIELLVKDIMDFDTAIREGTWVTRQCNHNSYGKGTACEYCTMAEMYKS